MPALSIPDLLPFPPQADSVILLTWTLGTPCTWLLNAYIASMLRGEAVSGSSGGGGGGGAGRGVVVVSFVNDERFVREGLRRGAGIDTALYEKLGKLKVIDGLSELFEPGFSSSSSSTSTTTNTNSLPSSPSQTQIQRPGSQAGIPLHTSRGLVPVRGGPPVGTFRQTPAPQGQQSLSHSSPNHPTISTTNNTSNSTKLRFDISITGEAGAAPGQNDTTKLTTVSRAISAALTSLASQNQNSKPLLAIESLDLLLASTLISAHDLWLFLLDLRELSHSLILTLSADTPLLTPAITLATNLFHNQAPPPLGAGQSSRLEMESSAFLGMAVHEAEWVSSLRLLDTGVAKDISGVIRITRGGSGSVGEDGERDREKEVLYYVGEGGGGVEIFDRGQVRG